MVELTQHGYKRSKTRTNTSGNQSLNRAEKAFWMGKDIEDFNNKEIQKYLKNVLQRSSGDTLKVLGNEIYLFGHQKLITVLKLNDKLIRKANRPKNYYHD